MTGDRAEVVEASLRKKVHDLDGLIHAVAVMPEHVHLAMSFPPTVSLAPIIGELKGASSFLVRRRHRDLVDQGFAWQQEYGIVSFNERDLPRVAAYVRNQELHHRHHNLSDTLEIDAEPTVS